MPAELDGARLKRGPRARRRRLEDERDRAPAQRIGAQRGRLELLGTIEQADELVTAQLLAGEEVAQHPGAVYVPGRCD